MPDVSILGGGISGVTTGLYLQLQGYDTEIYTMHRADTASYRDGNSTFATPYAAASILPHKMAIDRANEVFRTSQRFFDLFRGYTNTVRKQIHYELFEEERTLPGYWTEMDRFHLLDDDVDLSMVPHRDSVHPDELYGWRFAVNFARMPKYLPLIFNMYEKSGGMIHEQTCTRDEFLALPGDVLVNCTGYWSRDLFNDDELYIARGHLVHAHTETMPRDSAGRVFSYNYKADAIDGEAYYYPRKDALILGGSLQHGTPRPGSTEWDGETCDGRTVTVDGIEMPARVVETNTELVKNVTEDDIGDVEKEAFIGYRPMRDPVRIESEDIDGRTVVHNYGHGGAGITLSWGCAARAALLVNNTLSPGEKRQYSDFRGRLQQEVREF